MITYEETGSGLSRKGGPTRDIVILLLALGICSAHSAAHYSVLKSFGLLDSTGHNPYAPLIEGTDGALYGTTYAGGSHKLGAIIRVNKDGSNPSVLYSFIGTSIDGQNPQAGLLRATNGWLYGTTSMGGAGRSGTVFSLRADGSGYTNLHQFLPSSGDGATPLSGLMRGSDGALYGTTSAGGSNNFGTVFKMNEDGSGYTLLYQFSFFNNDGRTPGASVVQGTDGTLYGTTSAGGSNNIGTVFSLNTDGSNYRILHHFHTSGGDTRLPQSPLIEGSDGALYGTGSKGGSNNLGAVFTLQKDGSGYSMIFQFGNSTNGANPQAGLLEAGGVLFGVTPVGGTSNLGVIFRLNKDGSSYSALEQFINVDGDGANPQAGLLLASDGLLYGTTYNGGANTAGTVFKLATNGTQYGVIFSLGTSATDAANPQGSLVFGTNSILFGATVDGGSKVKGTIYSINPTGSGYSVLYNFTGSNGDGSSPWGSVVAGSDGRLYGTTHSGGSNNLGTIFAINPDGTGYSVLWNCSGNGDANNPAAGLIEGSDGKLYGTSYYGGSTGNGTVFVFDKGLGTNVILHNFNSTDGSAPWARLVQASDGALYGTTYYGGTLGLGVVFRLSTDGSGFMALHNFSSLASGPSGYADGTYPQGELLEADDGFMYGTTTSGGTNNLTSGTVFRITRDGTNYAILHSFSNVTDGGAPAYGLVQGRDGALYGVTTSGGSAGHGTIYMMNKDGTGFAVLRTLAGPDGASPSGSLLLSGNGVFYGTAYSGGDIGAGVLFEFFPPQTPDMIGATFTGPVAQVSLAGASGYQYSILRSADLGTWTELTNIVMPAGGFYTNTDSSPLPAAAYYRASWVP